MQLHLSLSPSLHCSPLPTHTSQILVATDVVSEGIDVPECSLVVVFDDLKNVTSFVQMRGRARKREGGAFIVMVPPGRFAQIGIEKLADSAQQFQSDRFIQAHKAKVCVSVGVS